MFPPASAKKRVCTSPGNPLPIPLRGWGGVPSSPWPLYEAQFRLGQIIVTDPSHTRALHHNGVFGHGALSNRGFDYDVFSKKLTLAQYRRKTSWRALEVSSQGLDSLKRKRDAPDQPCRIPRKYIYVMPRDSSKQEAECAGGRSAPEMRLMVDPFPIDEPLVLMPEEAVYLTFALGCLVVSDEQGKELSIDDLWQRLVRQCPQLVYRYPAYHQLRGDGWVVRSAPRYSADYMLYAVGPLYYHSQYLVRVEGHDAALLEPISPDHVTSTHYLNLLDRVATNVSKMFMLCLVLQPPSLTSTDSVLECVNKLRVEQLPFIWRNIDTSPEHTDGHEE